MKNTLFCILLLILTNLANADEVIHGETGDWSNHPLGLNTDNLDRFSQGSLAVAQALEAAKDGDASKFLTFWNVDTNNPPARVMDWYKEWKTNSQLYVYLIVEEAVMSGNRQSSLKQPFSAVSIAPTIPRQTTSSALTNGLPIRAQVVFLEKVSEEWKLVPESPDAKVEQAMLAKASLALYQSRSFSPEGLADQDKRFHQDFLALMQKNGSPPERITSQKENYQIEESNTQMKGWKDWTNCYHAVVLNPTVVFDQRDTFAYDYSQPVAAFRSYLYATWVGNGKTLLEHADTSGQRFLKNIGVTPIKKTPLHDLIPRLTHITVLLTATTVLEQKEYVLVFWRAQNESDAQQGSIALQSTIFVKNQYEYWLTRDLHDSYLGSILDIAHASGGIWKYDAFKKALEKVHFHRVFINSSNGILKRLIYGLPTSVDFWKTWISLGKTNSLMPAFAKAEGGPLTKSRITSIAKYLATAIPSHTNQFQ